MSIKMKSVKSSKVRCALFAFVTASFQCFGLPLSGGSLPIPYEAATAMSQRYDSWVTNSFLTGNYAEMVPGIFSAARKTTRVENTARPGGQKRRLTSVVSLEKPAWVSDSRVNKAGSRKSAKVSRDQLVRELRKKTTTKLVNEGSYLGAVLDHNGAMRWLQHEMEESDVKWEKITSSEKPEDTSEWLWSVIDMIDSALLANSKNEFPALTLTLALSSYDPGLAIVARALLRSVFDPNSSTYSNEQKAKISGWMSYMLIAHGHLYNWQAWVRSGYSKSKTTLPMLKFRRVQQSKIHSYDMSAQESGYYDLIPYIGVYDTPSFTNSQALWGVLATIRDDTSTYKFLRNDCSMRYPSNLSLRRAIMQILSDLFTLQGNNLTGLLSFERWFDSYFYHNDKGADWRSLARPLERVEVQGDNFPTWLYYAAPQPRGSAELASVRIWCLYANFRQ